MPEKRDYAKSEEITNAILHGMGLGLAIAALVVLIVLAHIHGNVWHMVGFSIYGSTLVILYLSSTLYHSFPQGKLKNIFRVFDHSSIFLLIAGTYTPLNINYVKRCMGMDDIWYCMGNSLGRYYNENYLYKQI